MIIFSVFFADWLSTLGLIPVSFTWLPDIALILLLGRLITQLARGKKYIRTGVELPFIFFVIWGVASMMINGTPSIGMIMSFRQLLKFAGMFFIIIQFQFKENFYKQITTILIILMTIQVPTALVKMMIYGRSEWAIGTYAYFGGGMTTILLLFVLSVCLGFYLFKKALLFTFFIWPISNFFTMPVRSGLIRCLLP